MSWLMQTAIQQTEAWGKISSKTNFLGEINGITDCGTILENME